MAGKKKERFPCEECGKVSKRNTHYSDLDNAYLCEGCRNLYRNNPICYIPPIGELHFDENGKVICHVCGRGGFDKLTSHLTQRHKITALEYKTKFGLNRTQSLTSEKYRETCRTRGQNDRDRMLELLGKYSFTTQYKKGESINKGRVLSVQARKNLAKKRSENNTIPVATIFHKKRKESERQRKIQEQLENQD